MNEYHYDFYLKHHNYYLKHKDRIKRVRREWYYRTKEERAEHVRNYQREYRLKNRDKLRAYKTEWVRR